jgi:hypothetical protein
MPVSATTQDVTGIVAESVERAYCQQLVLDELGLEWHARSFGLASETQAFEDFRNVEAAANADIL